MEGLDVAQVVAMRARWLARKDKNAVEIVPVATLIELADLVVCQAACLKQLDEGLTHLERMLGADRERLPIPERACADLPGAEELDAILGELALAEDAPAVKSRPRRGCPG